jgi:hypothetical protein
MEFWNSGIQPIYATGLLFERMVVPSSFDPTLFGEGIHILWRRPAHPCVYKYTFKHIAHKNAKSKQTYLSIYIYISIHI